MNLHDKSQQRGLAILIALFLFIVIYIFSKPASRKPIQLATNPQTTPVIDTPFSSAKSEADYFEKMESERGDIYNNRKILINKLKVIDKWLDFSGNYDQNGDSADNTLSADDKYGLNVQIVGSKMHVKEIRFTYFPNAIHGIRTYTLDDISKGVKVVCNQLGSDWSALHMGKIFIERDVSFKDSVLISDKKLVLDYQSDGQSIDITITHK